jgi:hypothetical protein
MELDLIFPKLACMLQHWASEKLLMNVGGLDPLFM